METLVQILVHWLDALVTTVLTSIASFLVLAFLKNPECGPNERINISFARLQTMSQIELSVTKGDGPCLYSVCLTSR